MATGTVEQDKKRVGNVTGLGAHVRARGGHATGGNAKLLDVLMSNVCVTELSYFGLTELSYFGKGVLLRPRHTDLI